MNRYSRLSRIQEKEYRAQIVVYSLVGIILLVLFVKIGIPAIFGLASTINNFRHSGPTANTPDNNLEIPSKPSLSAQYVATSSSSVKIRGIADPKINITFFKGDQLVDNTITDVQGKFTFDADLSSGTNKFSAQATDSRGKRSETSDFLEVKYITQPPKLELTAPADNTTIYNADGVDIVGKTDPGSEVTVNDSAAIVNASGEFRFFYRLASGDNKIKVKATDPAGNSSSKEITIKRPS